MLKHNGRRCGRGSGWKRQKTAKFGYLTKEEAESQWQEWLTDPAIKKDSLGPRCYTRVAVRIRDMITGFDQVAKQKELGKEERLSRTASAQLLADRAALVLGCTASQHADMVGGMDLSPCGARPLRQGLTVSSWLGRIWMTSSSNWSGKPKNVAGPTIAKKALASLRRKRTQNSAQGRNLRIKSPAREMV